MPLTDAEKVSIRRHLGLNSASAAWYPYIETFFSANSILETLPAATETECRAILTRLTDIETALDSARGRLKASEVGSIALNNEEPKHLRRELQHWRSELSTLLGIPLRSRGGTITVL